MQITPISQMPHHPTGYTTINCPNCDSPQWQPQLHNLTPGYHYKIKCRICNYTFSWMLQYRQKITVFNQHGQITEVNLQ